MWASVALAGPADSLPTPVEERCLGFIGEVGDAGAEPDGLHYDQVSAGLDAVIQTALQCPRPQGLQEVHLTYEFLISCGGLVEELKVIDAGKAPPAYVACVGDVIRKADFPAHDRADGMPVTYPVDVTW